MKIKGLIPFLSDLIFIEELGFLSFYCNLS
jgi:hypothetical protein